MSEHSAEKDATACGPSPCPFCTPEAERECQAGEAERVAQNRAAALARVKVSEYDAEIDEDPRCSGCYDSFSGPWCDNCDQWPCVCVTPPAKTQGGAS